MGNEELKETAYMLATFSFIVSSIIITAIFGWPTWPDRGEEILIGYIVVQILCILVASVLPTMFMRKVVQVSAS